MEKLREALVPNRERNGYPALSKMSGPAPKCGDSITKELLRLFAETNVSLPDYPGGRPEQHRNTERAHTYRELPMEDSFVEAVDATNPKTVRIGNLLDRYYNSEVRICPARSHLAAQQRPDDHKNLMVRVGGFSAYFVELDTQLQNEIIARTEQSLNN